MKLFILVIGLLSGILAEDVRLLDLDPPEAQQVIESKDQTLKYAPKIETNVPAVRFIGNEPRQVVEDIYLANQYHGQDGLGGYLYGYSVPDIAKTEKKKAGGDLRGAYNYVNGQGQEIKVEYWDDGTGFHQVDNVPKILPQQIDDTPEVKAAKEEHARIWQEQAVRNSKPVEYPFIGNQFKPEIAAQIGAQQHPGQNPGAQYQQQGGYQQGYSQGQSSTGQYQPQASQQHQYQQPQGQHQQGQYQQPQIQHQQGQGQYQQPQGNYQQQGQGQYQQPQGQHQQGQGQYQQPQIQHQQGQGQYQQPQVQHQQGQGQYQQPQGQYQSGGAYQKPGANVGLAGGDINNVDYTGQYTEPKGAFVNPNAKHQEEEEEVTGPPKGFFYNFDYPVGIIVSGKDGPQHQKRESITDVYNKNKEFLEKQLKEGSKLSGTSYPQYLITS